LKSNFFTNRKKQTTNKNTIPTKYIQLTPEEDAQATSNSLTENRDDVLISLEVKLSECHVERVDIFYDDDITQKISNFAKEHKLPVIKQYKLMRAAMDSLK
jgi:type III secretory pathway component EscU